MKKFFTHRNSAYFIFAFTALLFIISLYERYPHEDEAVIASHSYFFNKLGYVKSDLYGGYLDNDNAWEKRQYFYHKLFVLTGSLYLKIFGFNIYTFKAVTLTFLLIFFYALYAYLKKFAVHFSSQFYWFVCSLLLANNLFFEYSFVYRPEIMLMTIGFISFYFMHSGIQTKNYYFIAFAGMFAGLAAFTHLNGLIYSFAGFMVLMLKKEFRKGIVFAIPAGLFTLLYFFDIHSSGEFQAMLYQFQADPNVQEKTPFYIGLINEQIRFFHSHMEISFTLLLIFALFFNYKFLRKHYSMLLLYLLLLIIGLGMLSYGKTTKYGLNYAPYIAIIVVIAFTNIKQYRPVVKLTGWFLISVFFLLHGFYNIRLFSRHIHLSAYNKEIARNIPGKHVKISAPSAFVFNEIHHYTIRGAIAWDHHYRAFKPTEPRNLKSYFQFSEMNNDQYILIDKLLSSRKILFKIFERDLKINDVLYNYKVIRITDTYILFENINL